MAVTGHELPNSEQTGMTSITANRIFDGDDTASNLGIISPYPLVHIGHRNELLPLLRLAIAIRCQFDPLVFFQHHLIFRPMCKFFPRHGGAFAPLRPGDVFEAHAAISVLARHLAHRPAIAVNAVAITASLFD